MRMKSDVRCEMLDVRCQNAEGRQQGPEVRVRNLICVHLCWPLRPLSDSASVVSLLPFRVIRVFVASMSVSGSGLWFLDSELSEACV